MARSDRFRFAAFVLVVLLLLPWSEVRAQAEPWEWTIVPYIWLSNLSGRSVVGQREVTLGDSSLTAAGALWVEARRRRVGLRLVATRATLGNPAAISSVTDPTQQISGRYDFSWTSVEMHGALQIGPLNPDASFSVYLGFRYVHQSQWLRDGEGEEIRASQVWVEPVEGSQYVVRVARRIQASIAGDIGGFAVGSDFTWTLTAEIAFRAMSPLDLVMRYSYREVQYDNKEDGAKTYRWDGGVQQGWFFGLALKLPPR